MKTQDINTARAYAIVFIEGQSTVSHPAVKLADFYAPTMQGEDLDLGGLHEWKYAVQENMDAILDLRQGEVLHMNFNRDSSDAQGVIKRIF